MVLMPDPSLLFFHSNANPSPGKAPTATHSEGEPWIGNNLARSGDVSFESAVCSRAFGAFEMGRSRKDCERVLQELSSTATGAFLGRSTMEGV